MQPTEAACGKCGAAIDRSTKFCGKCGEPIPKEKKKTAFGIAPVGPPPDLSKTVADEPREAATLVDPPRAKAADQAATIVELKTQEIAEPAPPEPVTANVPKGRRGGFGKTVMGLGGAMPELAEPDRTPAPRTSTRHRTKLGMPTAPEKEEEGKSSIPPAMSNRTMLGMPVKPSRAEPASSTSADANDPVEKTTQPIKNLNLSNRTMMGMAQVPTERQAPPAQSAPEADSAPVALPGSRSSSVVPWLLALVFLAGVAAAGVAAVLYFLKEDITLNTAVVREDGRDALEVTVDGAKSGTRVRLFEQDQALDGNSARFELAADSLVVGDNRLTVLITPPGGDPIERQVSVVVNYRVRADLSGFANDPPTFELVVEAIEGSGAVLGGEELAMTARGSSEAGSPEAGSPESGAVVSGRREYPLEASTEESHLNHSVPYTVTLPGGGERTGELTTRVPFAALRLDRPGLRLVTDRDEVEVAGAVHAEAQVTVNGTAVPVNSGRFLHRLPVPLASGGGPNTLEPVIVVRREDRAPRTVTPEIRRVRDLAVEARSFEFDRRITYARLRTDVDTYVGQAVALEGRVYNVDIQNGQSVLQVLARTCPPGSQCPTWITYSAATDAEVDSWVRVLGTVAGEQQFRSETDQVYRVPRIDATYILPLAR